MAKTSQTAIAESQFRSDTPATGVVVINQHGDNRGDEAAMRAMITHLSEGLPDAQFTIVHQFSDPRSQVDLDVPVEYIDIRPSVVEALRLSLFAALSSLRIPWDGVLGRHGRMVVDRYRAAQLVISAPGGPYFGDMYANHEVVHWFYVWLAHLLNRRLFLYAPSAGPFENKLLNPLRRRAFRWFDAVTLRDPFSAEYLRGLMGDKFEVEVTADSALQDLTDETGPEESESFTLAVSVRDPGPEIRDEYESAVLSAIEAVSEAQPTQVVFLPQLHGPRHKDQPYLETIAAQIKGAQWVRVESGDDLDSREHRRIISEADLVIAGRYHPAVFAIASRTPVLVIPYEHKAWGVARQAGIEHWTVDLSEARGDRLATTMKDLLTRSEEVKKIMNERVHELRQLSLRTTEIALDLIGRT